MDADTCIDSCSTELVHDRGDLGAAAVADRDRLRAVVAPEHASGVLSEVAALLLVSREVIAHHDMHAPAVAAQPGDHQALLGHEAEHAGDDGEEVADAPDVDTVRGAWVVCRHGHDSPKQLRCRWRW